MRTIVASVQWVSCANCVRAMRARRVSDER
jgi:hypothetical protein